MEEHITFINESSNIFHCAVSSKKAEVVYPEIIKVLQKTKSTSSVKILASDGEPANIGHLGNDFHSLTLRGPTYFFVPKGPGGALLCPP